MSVKITLLSGLQGWLPRWCCIATRYIEWFDYTVRVAPLLPSLTNKYFSNLPLSLPFSRVSLGVNLHTLSLLSLWAETSQRCSLSAVCVCFCLHKSQNWLFFFNSTHLQNPRDAALSVNCFLRFVVEKWKQPLCVEFFFVALNVCQSDHCSWCAARLCSNLQNLIWILHQSYQRFMTGVWDEVCNMMHWTSWRFFSSESQGVQY